MREAGRGRKLERKRFEEVTGGGGILAGEKTEEMRRRERYDIYHGS